MEPGIITSSHESHLKNMEPLASKNGAEAFLLDKHLSFRGWCPASASPSISAIGTATAW